MLFEGATSQYVDDNGKTRMLKYGSSGVSLMISPIPPLNLPLDRQVSEVSFSVAKRFMEKKELEILSQDGSGDRIWGIWVAEKESPSSIYYAYIPLVEEKALPGIQFSDPTKNDPIRTEPVAQSDLRTYQRDRKIADYLRRYTLFAYATDPENFGEDSFAIVPSHVYDIESLNKRLFIEGNKVMFRGKKLIVLTEDMRGKLLDYLNVSLLNDRQGVMKIRHERTIDVFYQSISDFRTAPNQLVFMTREAVMRWKTEVARSQEATQVHDTLDSSTREPYYHRNLRFRQNSPCIVQNVLDGTIERAVAVSMKWIEGRNNIGFYAGIPEDVEEMSYEIYDSAGNIEKHKSSDTTYAPVVRYDDGTYGALLFI